MMILTSLFELLYPKIFVSILYTQENVKLHIDYYKKSTLFNTQTKTFLLEEEVTQVHRYIEGLNEESPFVYVAILNTINKQGALLGCDNSTLNSEIGTMDVTALCINKQWMIYTDKEELNLELKKHKSYGIDYVFSPFHVIKVFFEDKMDDTKRLFALIDNNSVAISVFQNGFLVYAQYINLEESEKFEESEAEDSLNLEFDMQLESESGIQLDDIDALDELDDLSDLDDLSNLSDIEDLDAFEELDEFTHGSDTLSSANQSEEVDISKEINNFDAEYIQYNTIKKSIQFYYNDTRYDNEFIEDIYIADSLESSEDLKRYLEEELFLNVVIRKIDLAKEIAQLSYKESQYV